MKIVEKIQSIESIKLNLPKVNVIILDVQTTKVLKQLILGRSMAEWVAFACGKYNPRRLEYDCKISILEYLKNQIENNSDYTMVLLSTTPLITCRTVDRIVEFATIKQSNICKLPVGYIFKNSAIYTGITFVDSVYSQDIEDFYIVENKKQYNFALETLQDRINTFHMENGVDILKPKSVYIEPTVDIEPDVKIYSGNTLKGETYISSGVMLKENNVIESTRIGLNSCISNSVIKNSSIGENVYISPFCEINNSQIGEYCIINKGASINNYTVKESSKIEANLTLGETNDSDNRTW